MSKAAASRRHYRKNRAGRIAQSQARAAKGRAIIRAAKDVPCADCGIRYPPHVLDFDHVRGVKAVTVGTMLTYSETAIRAEIAKCDVVCSNCHRERTQIRYHQETT